MNKTLVVWLAIALVLIAAGAALLAAGMAGGSGWQSLWKGMSFSFGGIGQDFLGGKDYTVCGSGEESFSADKVQSLDIGWAAGLVTVEPGGGSKIVVKERCEQALKDEEKLCWKLEDGRLSLRYCTSAATNLPGKNLTVTVPAAWYADLVRVNTSSASSGLEGLTVGGALEATATSGSVRVTDCSCDRLVLGATSGSLVADGCVCKELQAGATSGSVKLQDCFCDTLDAGTTSGSISVRCEAKEMKLGSTSGSIRCEDVPALCDVDCGTTSGTVRMSLRDANNGQSINISVTSGDVYLDVPGAIDLKYDSTSGDLRGSLTQGGAGTCPRVRVDATSGDLILGKFN